MEYQWRQFERSSREIQEVNRKVSELLDQVKQPEPTDEPMDEIDKVAQKDWKKGVSMVIEQALENREKRLREERSKQSRVELLETSKQRVLERYPSLADESSEESKHYMEVINEDPSLLHDSRGPELAMYKMEEKLRSEGRVLQPEKQAVHNEVIRQTRVQATSVPKGRQPSSEGKIVLTASEKELCDQNGWPYDRYVAMREKTGQQLKEGVSVE